MRARGGMREGEGNEGGRQRLHERYGRGRRREGWGVCELEKLHDREKGKGYK